MPRSIIIAGLNKYNEVREQESVCGGVYAKKYYNRPQN